MHELSYKERLTRRTLLQRHTARLRSTCAIAVVAVIVSVLSVLLPSGPANATNACPPTFAFSTGYGIALRSNCGNTTSQITAYPTDSQPALSPDGSKVAFVRQDNSNGNYDIWVASTKGGPLTKITNLGSYIWRISWSPDERRLAFSTEYYAVVQVATVNSDGSGGLTWLNSSFSAAEPVWCGSTLVVAHPDATNPSKTNLFTMSPNGTIIAQLTSGIVTDAQPACTPDNKWVVFYEGVSAPTGNTSGLYAVPIMGGNPVLLRPGGSDQYSEPTVAADWTMAFWSATAHHIVFQWLGGKDAVSYGSGTEQWPSFAHGPSTTSAPAGFPVAWGAGGPPITTMACPAAQMIAVRGSRANLQDTSVTDKETLAVKDGVQTRFSGLGFEAIPYSAIPVGYGREQYGGNYISSIEDGETALQRVLGSFLAACPHTYVVLVGYSQGAQVVSDVYLSLGQASQSHIVLATFGNPIFNSGQSRADQGSYQGNLNGIFQFISGAGGLMDVPTQFIKNVHNYCTAGDPVCNYSKRNLAFCAANVNACPHVHYVNLGWTADAASWIVSRLRHLPPL
jgi:cutinase/WD40 repeat protein